MKKTKL